MMMIGGMAMTISAPRLSARSAPPPRYAGGQAQRHAEREDNSQPFGDGQQAAPAAVQQPAQDIPAQGVGAEQVMCARTG